MCVCVCDVCNAQLVTHRMTWYAINSWDGETQVTHFTSVSGFSNFHLFKNGSSDNLAQ